MFNDISFEGLEKIWKIDPLPREQEMIGTLEFNPSFKFLYFIKNSAAKYTFQVTASSTVTHDKNFRGLGL